MKPEEQVLYARDIMLVTGLRYSAVYRLTKRIRVKYGLNMKCFIPIDLFCEYTGIPEKKVRMVLQDPHFQRNHH